MGEEGKKMEDVKESKQETKAEKPLEDGKKPDEAKAEPSPAPAPPQEIVLRVFMHCEGCARKVKRCLKGFEGVEEVITDCKSSKVTVKGEKADPLKVLQRIQKKSHRKAELISPIPNPQNDDVPKKTEEKEVVLVKPPSQKKEEESVVVSVVLGIYMHCDACAQEIKKRIERMKGVENAEADLKSSQVTVKGAFEPEKLTEYVFKKTGKHATVVKVVEPERGEKGKDGENEVKKGEEGEKNKKNKEGVEENKSEVKEVVETEEGEPKLEMKRNDSYYYNNNNYNPQNYYQLYPQRFVQEMNAYPPQMFSDENPNACFVM